MGDFTASVPSFNVGPIPAASLQTLSDALTALTGAWTTTHTPTLGNLTLGSGTSVFSYRRLGKTLDFWWIFTLGAGSAVGSGPTFTIPAALHSRYFATGCKLKIGWASCSNSGVADYDLSLRHSGSGTPTVLEVVIAGTNGLHALVTSTAPFTFGTGDAIAAGATGLELA